MKTSAGPIVLTTGSPAAPESTSEAADLWALRGRGWDAHLVMPGPGRNPSWAGAGSAGPFHECWRKGARLGAGLALVRGGAAGPIATWHSLRALEGGSGAWCRRRLAGHLLALHPRLIHFYSARWAAEWLGVVHALRRPIVVTLTAEDLYASGPSLLESCAQVCSRAAALHFHDAALEQRALRRGCRTNGASAVIPPPVDTSAFAPDDAPDGAPRPDGGLQIVSAGPLEWMQGFEHAIHAVRLLRDAGVEGDYTIFGDGEYLPALAFARRQLDVDGQVHLPAEVETADLARSMRSADVFLSSAVVDGMPTGALQAMASGIPVVMSDPGPLPYVAEIDEQLGFVVPRRDPRALAEKLAILARDERLRRDMGRAARRWALEHLSAPQRLDDIERLYQEVLAGSPE